MLAFSSLMANLILLSLCSWQVSSLKCFSCSTAEGHLCEENEFDPINVRRIECPPTADVCIRAIQLNNGTHGAVFRACGSSDTSKNKEILLLGYYPPYNECVVRKIGAESQIFNGYEFQICACSNNLSNGPGPMKCQQKKENNFLQKLISK